jgi:multidrug efflux pump
VSTGAGAHSRIAIGTAVIGGMVFGTVLAVFFVPLAFVGVRRYMKWGHSSIPSKRGQTSTPG